jgi:HPt (histidine-containing phosphotransfer) domain-containing protein
MIDWNLFNMYLSGFDISVISELIDMFIKDYPERISELRKSVEEKDFHQIDYIAHDLKTDCARFGDNESRKLAFNLELMGKKKVNDNSLLRNTDPDSWNQLEKMAKNKLNNNMNEVFAQFATASGTLIKELEQYKKIHSS